MHKYQDNNMELRILLESISIREIEKKYKIMEKMKGLHLKIDFAVNPKNERDMKFKVYFEGSHTNLFSKRGKGPLYFEDSSKIFYYIADSIASYYQYSDRKMVAREVFDSKTLDAVENQLASYINDFKNKAKSLTTNDNDKIEGESGSDWDMEIIFRRRMQQVASGGEWKMFPVLTQQGNHGKIVSPREVEVYDKSLWHKKRKRLTSS